MSVTRNKIERLIVQAQNVGKSRWRRIGWGRHGDIELTFSHPEASAKAIILDENTGDTRFLPAQKVEKGTNGRIQVRDFPRLSRQEATGINRASVAGAQFENVHNSGREKAARRAGIGSPLPA